MECQENDVSIQYLASNIVNRPLGLTLLDNMEKIGYLK